MKEENISTDCMTSHGFKKITPCNGFDVDNPDNAKQNNYAWSMAEMGDYIYVGTARDIPYGAIQYYFPEMEVPDVFVPKHVDMNGEIWRYKKDGTGKWERVYKAPQELGTIGFRFMFTYTTPAGETAIYAGCMTLVPNIILIKSTDGMNWVTLYTGITTGSSTRSVVEHGGKLYMAVLNQSPGLSKTYLYTSTDPERDGWELIDLSGAPEKNPRGGADILLSFNNCLYVATELPGGFELWRTKGFLPEKDNWKLVVDKGAGDALNEVACSAGVFKDYLYIGTAIWAAVGTIDPKKRFAPPKGFDLIRVDCNDKWELVAGGLPIAPTEPTTGNRGLALSGQPSGFGDMTNAYCWQIQEHGGELYLGTFSWAVIVPAMIPSVRKFAEENSPYDIDNYMEALVNYLKFVFQADHFFNLFPVELIAKRLLNSFFELVQKTYGFDFWKTRDGVHWTRISIDGLGNPYNYGLRMLFPSSDGRLYIGTANPFEGCEVWVKETDRK